jgi:hypothetical protein
MAEIAGYHDSWSEYHFGITSASPVTVTTATPTSAVNVIGDVTLQHSGGKLCLEVQNHTAENLKDLILQRKDHPDGEFYDYLASADWTSALTGGSAELPWLLYADNTPNVLPGSSTCHCIVDVTGAWALRFQAKTSANTTTVSVRGNSVR